LELVIQSYINGCLNGVKLEGKFQFHANVLGKQTRLITKHMLQYNLPI